MSLEDELSNHPMVSRCWRSAIYISSSCQGVYRTQRLAALFLAERQRRRLVVHQLRNHG
jgi:hypothetical protein